MKVFMTGGTGFVVSNLRAWMVHEGHTDGFSSDEPG